ncbi:alpha/beta hydrolase [Kribbella sp. NBC_01505]|uniref:alpha/beta fold hydrolase n=1 Tax=Kribbella sp. NBC_01505 TaxID=2903580 RepID=UPI003868CF9F
MSDVSSCLVDGADLVYSYRSGAGPCVVFISGLGESGVTWRTTIGLMSEGAATFTYDRAGCGGSGGLPAEVAAEERSIGWGAEQLLKVLELDQEVLVRSGGAVRVSVEDGAFTVWDSAGPRGAA